MKVSKEAADHFNKAARFYRCPPEEVELMRAAYEDEPEGAAICFAAIAAHVDRVSAPAVEVEHTLTGPQFLKLGLVAKEMEARRDA